MRRSRPTSLSCSSLAGSAAGSSAPRTGRGRRGPRGRSPPRRGRGHLPVQPVLGARRVPVGVSRHAPPDARAGAARGHGRPPCPRVRDPRLPPPGAGVRSRHGHRRRRRVRGRAGRRARPVPRELRGRVRPGGLFLFDFITPAGRRRYTFRNSRALAGGRIAADSRGRFDEAARTLSVDLTLETPHHVAHERHVMRLYSVEEIEAALRRQGFDVIVVTDLYDGARRLVPDRSAILRRAGPAAMRAGER